MVSFSIQNVISAHILLFSSTDVDAVDGQGNTALHLAVLAGSPEMVTMLLKKGANVLITNNTQMMPIHLAAELPGTDVMKVCRP